MYSFTSLIALTVSFTHAAARALDDDRSIFETFDTFETLLQGMGTSRLASRRATERKNEVEADRRTLVSSDFRQETPSREIADWELDEVEKPLERAGYVSKESAPRFLAGRCNRCQRKCERTFGVLRCQRRCKPDEKCSRSKCRSEERRCDRRCKRRFC